MSDTSTEAIIALTNAWDDLKENLPSDGHAAAELLFDHGDLLADALNAMMVERDAATARAENAETCLKAIGDRMSAFLQKSRSRS
jgi:hypothetical protein